MLWSSLLSLTFVSTERVLPPELERQILESVQYSRPTPLFLDRLAYTRRRCREVASLRLVCRDWNVFFTPVLYSSVIINMKNLQRFQTALTMHPDRCDLVRRLDAPSQLVATAFGQSWAKLISVPEFCFEPFFLDTPLFRDVVLPQLQEMRITIFPPPPSAVLVVFPTSDLVSLSVPSTLWLDSGSATLLHPHLTSLDIYGRSNLPPTSTAVRDTIRAYGPNLLHLGLPAHHDQHIDSETFALCPRLRSLHIRGQFLVRRAPSVLLPHQSRLPDLALVVFSEQLFKPVIASPPAPPPPPRPASFYPDNGATLANAIAGLFAPPYNPRNDTSTLAFPASSFVFPSSIRTVQFADWSFEEHARSRRLGATDDRNTGFWLPLVRLLDSVEIRDRAGQEWSDWKDRIYPPRASEEVRFAWKDLLVGLPAYVAVLAVSIYAGFE